MRHQVRLWSVKDGKLIELSGYTFSDVHKEKDLEDWVFHNPSLLDRDLSIIGRQVYIPKVGPLDLLAVDGSGRLVVIEFKRQQTTRDTIAQILDYASSIRRMNVEQLNGLANIKDADLSEITNFDPAMILVAAEADDAAERIVEFLVSKAQLAIEVVTFTYATLDDAHEIIARSVLAPETVDSPGIQDYQISRADLFTIADERKVRGLVEKLNQVSKLGWFSEMFRSAGGKIRYSVEMKDGVWRVLFGMNVGGEKYNSPEGSLDVWFRPEVISDYAELPREFVVEQINKFQIVSQTDKRTYARIKNDSDATRLYSLLEEWDAAGKKSSSTVTP